MFNTREEKQLPSTITILDVDETCIMGHDAQGHSIDRFNDELISALVLAGIKQVYLLTSMSLKLPLTAQDRNELKQKTRLDLIDYLDSKGISVVAVISNHDLVHAPEEKTAQFTAIPGPYYRDVIHTFEKLIRVNPAVDLSKDAEYLRAFERQEQEYEPSLHKLTNSPVKTNVKELLANKLFACIKDQCEQMRAPMPCFQFLDDRQICLDSVASAAVKCDVDMRTLQVTKQLVMQDYLHFFNPLLQYQHLIADSFNEISRLKINMNKQLSGFIRDLPNKALLLVPLQKILSVYEKIQGDIKSPRHDCTGACNALVNEMLKRAQELRDIYNTLQNNTERDQCEQAINVISNIAKRIPSVGQALQQVLKSRVTAIPQNAP